MANIVECSNLTKRYVKGYAPALDHANLTIPEGSGIVGLLGPNGSGKTTLIKLLLGFYEPLGGEIQVGDASLSEYNLGWWRSQCGAVMQEGYLFSDTIARNIAISDDEPDIERIRYAARVANIADYIEALPLAYNTMIGQDGQGRLQYVVPHTEVDILDGLVFVPRLRVVVVGAEYEQSILFHHPFAIADFMQHFAFRDDGKFPKIVAMRFRKRTVAKMDKEVFRFVRKLVSYHILFPP